MAIGKLPLSKEIPWDKISEIRVSSDQSNYSFEFDLRGKKQKMTISVAPGSTSFTLSGDDGSPIVHATQKGQEIKVVDFSAPPTLAKPAAKLKGVRIAKKK